ncbi:mechanosensitive ion channel family protein [Thermicanus aegyptius]|uniref:mechanosensitive ion channel family protein n=1 Tax=Thermicanus aegyptius TaxID=94009 RepID=UPI000408350D|nr:mechanosensitive ion channel family protein [Thermicanus aegyptius]
MIEETFKNLDTTSSKIWTWLSDPNVWLNWAEKLLLILLILFGMRITKRIGHVLIERVLKKREGSRFQIDERRVTTLRVLLKNVADYTITFIGILLILSFFMNILPVLAGAGVLGLAVAFGAQNLVRDIISGFFIIFEDQFAVGDYVRIGNFEGTVKQIGLRITKIRAFTGEIHILPNGTITEVTNFSTSNSVAIVDLSIAYEERIPQVIEILEEEVNKLFEGGEIPEMVKKPEVLGVHALGPSEVVIRIVAETKPAMHWKVRRILQSRLKEVLDQRGIEIPYPHLVTVSKTGEGAKNE